MKIANKQLVFFLLGLLSTISTFGQPVCSFEHFSVEDGLPHNTINHIIQDQKGFIWLATFDGICKYDGYSFYNYKPQPSDGVLMKSNRVDKIAEDKYGRIWMNAYSSKAYCFDPKTETFWGTELIPKISNNEFDLSHIITNPSGLVWLLSDNDGCICISDTLYSTTLFNRMQKNMDASAVFSVYEDKQQNSWILTNNGLVFIPENKLNQPNYFFTNEQNKLRSFYSAIEIDDEIWFGGSNGMIAKYSKGGKSFRTQKLELKANIIQLEKLNDQTILGITDQEGFCTINIYSGITKIFNKTTYPEIKTKNLIPIAVTHSSELWFVSNHERGICQFDFTSEKLLYYPSQSHDVATASVHAKAFVLTDNRGQIWVQPYGGGFSLYNESNKQLVPFTSTTSQPNRKFSNIFHTFFFDRQGNLWYNTQSTGLVKVIFSKNNFKTFELSNNNHYSLTKDVRALFQDRKENIWVSSKENQIVILDKNRNILGALSPEGKLQKESVWRKPAYVITEDNLSNIWIGTRGDGIYKLTPKQKAYSYTVEHFTSNISNHYSLSNNNIYSIFQDNKNRIWIATYGGGINLAQNNSVEKTKFIHSNNLWKNNPTNRCNKVRCITETPSGKIYAGTTDGLLVFDPDKISDAKLDFKLYEKTLQPNSGINSNDIVDICITQQNELFIATAGGGLNKVAEVDSLGFPVAFKTYKRQDGLPSNYILSMLEDYDGKIWISSNNSLTRFDPKTEFLEVFSDVKWTLPEKNFSEATRCKLNSGELFFGYSNGVLHFFPDQIKTNTFSPYLALTKFQLASKKVNIGENSPLLTSIDNCKNLVLSHNQNFFNIEYAALDYENPKNIKYAYKLEGFDNDWNYVQKQRTAIFTNVPKGEYIFKVKSTNSEGVWANNERFLPIEVKPSFWETPWAYSLYFLAFAMLIVLIDYNLLTIYRLKSNMKLEQKMSAMKQKFFIDISHEIRTPLTMISAPVEYLINDNRTPDKVKKQLTYISQSTSRMLRLVNQILDFRKMQEYKMKVVEIDFAQFVIEIFNDFTELAKENDITFTLQNNAEHTKIWVDKNSLEKIIMNLLSNAFKYTPNGKSISVRLTNDEKQVSIHVIDEGIGIAKEKQKKLFVRFESFNKNAGNPSTGIGLSLIKELADKHSAKVTLESEANKGSHFAVHFLKGKNHFSEEVQFVTKNQDIEQNTNVATGKRNEKKTSIEKAEIKILLIEDDPDLRSFMKTILENDYQILEAEDGELGYQKTLDKNPDFIVSDIMMPKMDGIELLKRLRGNIKTSHIPIILLTAKTNIESKLEGISYGADDYITKPFSVPYFTTRIENLLNQRKRLQEIFGANNQLKTKTYNPKPFLITSQDEEIMEKVMQTVEKNIDNSEFTVEDLATSVGLNRTTMFYKLKSLTGFSPVEFIRDIRLKRAAQLITDSQLLIKEISYMIGFSDLKYFGKCFKTKYGMTPMEFRKQKK